MEFSDVINTQYAFHGIIVGCVLAFAILVFVFGFKSAEEPPFDKLTNTHEDRKGTGKKKKLKDKKNQSNGHATAVAENSSSGNSGGNRRADVKSLKKEHDDKSPIKEQKKQEKKSPAKAAAALKETKQNKEEKNINNSSERKARGKENVEIKNKKNKVVDEKPKDFDDGEWEQALSKRDKKNRKTALEEILPQKPDKKKDKKKVKEETELKPEVVAEVVAAAEIPEIEEKIVVEKSEPPLVETSIEPVAEAKPKKAKKKKQNSESSNAGVDEKVTVVEEVNNTQPKQQRPKKNQPETVTPTTVPQAASTPAPPSPESIKTEILPNVETPTESNVVFDELGDNWKEAKVPKKNQKKKSRKD